jgi:ParB family chromosome partitioning protein
MTDTTTRPSRRTAKPGGRKTANRFAKLAGGDDVSESDSSPTPTTETAGETGLIAGMSAFAAEEAHRVVEIAVADIAPHPFNDETRSQPHPGEAKWDELVNAVRSNGVRLPVLVVQRDAFAATRPAAAQSLAPEARYVLIYGHRRRAAALEAGRATVPAVVDDAIMADDGDLDAMAAENLGREDLSDLAEADLFARYSEIGLSQRAIADRLGVDQATVSRRLALLLLAPDVRRAVSDGVLSGADAAALSGKLPYGPPRRWQKSKDASQDTPQRRAEQIQAQNLVLEHNWSASRAAERVIAEREARATAAALGIALVSDPIAEIGDTYLDHRISQDEFSAGDEVFGCVNANTGDLDLYRRPASNREDTAEHSTAPSPAANPAAAKFPPGTTKDRPTLAEGDGEGGMADAREDEPPTSILEERSAEVAAAAQAHRRQSCAALITHHPTNAELLKVLVRQYLSGVAARCQTSAVNALLRDWDATADGTGDKARNIRTWQRAIAAAELHTAELKDRAWDDDAVAHVTLLVERVGYQPTPWERDQLDTALR